MTKPPNSTDIERLAASLCNLIDALIRLFPEGISEELDEDVFLTLLAKAKEDAEAMKAAILARTK
jgi:hypothetical protein